MLGFRTGFRTGRAGPAENTHNDHDVRTPAKLPPDMMTGPSTPPLELMLDFRTGGAGPAENMYNEHSVEMLPKPPPDATTGLSTLPLELMLDFRLGARPAENVHKPCPDMSTLPLALMHNFRTGARHAENTHSILDAQQTSKHGTDALDTVTVGMEAHTQFR
jgi:hypothetical protein